MIRGSITAVPGAHVKRNSGATVVELTADEKAASPPTCRLESAEVIVRAGGHELPSLHHDPAGATVKAEYLLRPLPSYRRPFENHGAGARSATEGRNTSPSAARNCAPFPGTGRSVSYDRAPGGVATLLPLLPVSWCAAPAQHERLFPRRHAVPQLFHLLVGGGVIHARFVDRFDFIPALYDASFGRYAGGIIDARTAARRQRRLPR